VFYRTRGENGLDFGGALDSRVTHVYFLVKVRFC
jgi:hypothetical protein